MINFTLPAKLVAAYTGLCAWLPDLHRMSKRGRIVLCKLNGVPEPRLLIPSEKGRGNDMVEVNQVIGKRHSLVEAFTSHRNDRDSEARCYFYLAPEPDLWIRESIRGIIYNYVSRKSMQKSKYYPRNYNHDKIVLRPTENGVWHVNAEANCREYGKLVNMLKKDGGHQQAIDAFRSFHSR